MPLSKCSWHKTLERMAPGFVAVGVGHGLELVCECLRRVRQCLGLGPTTNRVGSPQQAAVGCRWWMDAMCVGVSKSCQGRWHYCVGVCRDCIHCGALVGQHRGLLTAGGTVTVGSSRGAQFTVTRQKSADTHARECGICCLQHCRAGLWGLSAGQAVVGLVLGWACVGWVWRSLVGRVCVCCAIPSLAVLPSFEGVPLVVSV